MSLSWGDAIRMQDELIEAFVADEFQKELHARWPEAGDDLVEQAKLRQKLCLEIQGPIISKYGFEASRKGLANVLKAFGVSKLGLDPHIQERAVLLEWLVHPGLQAETPAPIGDAAKGRFAMNCLRGPVQPPPRRDPLEEGEGEGNSAAHPAGQADKAEAAAPPKAEGESSGPAALLLQAGQVDKAAALLKANRKKFVKMQAELLAVCRAHLQEARTGTAGSPDVAGAATEDTGLAAQHQLLRKCGSRVSRKELVEMDKAVACMAESDAEISANQALLDWLLQITRTRGLDLPGGQGDVGAGPAAPTKRVGEYNLYVTEPNDVQSVHGIERCKGALACAHQALYRKVHPGVQQKEWLGVLGRDGIQSFVKEGGIVLHAEHEATGEIVGYVSCRCGAGEDAQAARHKTGGPCATINHIGVLPKHQGRGIGTALFENLLGILRDVAAGAETDLRINVVELNTRAVGWYRRLGFFPVQLWTRCFSVAASTARVVFLTMQRRSDLLAKPWECFFGHSLKKERVIIFPATAPLAFLVHAAEQQWPPLGVTAAVVAGFDEGDLCHSLEDGRVVNLTHEFVHGRVVFERPLHCILPINMS